MDEETIKVYTQKIYSEAIMKLWKIFWNYFLS